jgi:uncharacterized membrane protein YeaQ/YmgE (transglycosylase-associated protein family)
MTLTTFVTWIVVAVVIGWAAAVLARDGGHGIKADVLLAVAGSGVASVGAAGIDLFPQSGLAASAVVAVVGAVAAIAVQRKFFDAPLR